MTNDKSQKIWMLRVIAPLGFCFLLLALTESAHGQGQVNWLATGSLENWFSEKGWEIEEGNVQQQQYGLRWPAQYSRQDMQAAKGMWIGVKNFTDLSGVGWTEKVVHVGPRVAGDGEFYPMQFALYSRFDPPSVVVDGLPSSKNLENLTGTDPTMKADRMLVSVVNTAIGVTVTRKIYQFSQQYHDNYHIFEMTFTNTGYIDNTNVKQLNQTLTGLYVFWQWRYSVCQEVRYMINNSAGWGINAMNDARGPWYTATPTDIRAHFTWNGFHNAANKPNPPGTFDNIGAPIFNPATYSNAYIDPSDTTWRLGGAQFVGNVHLHADNSPADSSDDPAQPSTTTWVASDDPTLTQRNDQFNQNKMTAEYNKMQQGHVTPHAWQVVPTGNFDQQTIMANINSPTCGDGSPGGFSSANGYGPYTLAPGESIKIVFAEGADGLTRDECIRIGKLYKSGSITTQAKNDSVLINGQNRVISTFRRAIANYNSGYNIPQPPFPPSTFTVRSSGNKIGLLWTANPQESAKGFQGYRVYRATAKVDSNYSKVFECGVGTANPTVVYSFDDTSLTRGINYYYYITTFGSAAANTGVGNTPAGPLESSRFLTQTYVPANLKRPPGTSASQIRIAPNPYNISANQNALRFPGQPDKIAFFNIPGNCEIKIYTELGELINTIIHDDGTGDAYWNSTTSSNQIIASGVYIVVFNNRDTGERTIKKLVVIR